MLLEYVFCSTFVCFHLPEYCIMLTWFAQKENIKPSVLCWNLRETIWTRLHKVRTSSKIGSLGVLESLFSSPPKQKGWHFGGSFFGKPLGEFQVADQFDQGLMPSKSYETELWSKTNYFGGHPQVLRPFHALDTSSGVCPITLSPVQFGSFQSLWSRQSHEDSSHYKELALLFHDWTTCIDNLPKTNIAPENRPSQKET